MREKTTFKELKLKYKTLLDTHVNTTIVILKKKILQNVFVFWRKRLLIETTKTTKKIITEMTYRKRGIKKKLKKNCL